MILDASVVIALRSPRDAHAERAARLVLDADRLIVHPVTLAECLVVPARRGVADAVEAALRRDLGVEVWQPADDEPRRVAGLRAAVRIALPDCYPLALAEETGQPLATFDAALAEAAAERGVPVVA